MFAAILGLAGAGLSAGASMFGASQQAEVAYAQMQAQERMARMQRDMAMMNYGLSRDQMRKQDENNEYMRRIEQLNRRIREEERDFAKDYLKKNQTQLNEERKYTLQRQIDMDREAAKQRQFQIEQLLRNQNLAADERAFAIKQLEEAKAVAAGERDQDLRRFYEEREVARGEREFAQGQLAANQRQMMSERNLELNRRRSIEDQVARLQAALGATQAGLGVLPDIPTVTRADFDAEEARRADIMIGDVDRAAERVASVNAAKLAKGGVDRSTTATQSQADIAKRLAGEYNKARMMARDEAFKYITGQQGVDMAVYDKKLGQRKYALDEAGAVNSAGLDAMMRMPNLPTAVSNDYMRLPTANYTRGLVSGNNYRAPVDIRTGIYNMDVPMGMGATLNAPSAANYSFLNLPSSITGPAQLNISDPGTYAQLAMSGMNTALQSANDMSKFAIGNAALSNRYAGQAFENFYKQLSGGDFGKWLDSYFTSQQPVGSSFQAPAGTSLWSPFSSGYDFSWAGGGGGAAP